MKKFVSGLIIGLLLTTTVFASSEQIQAVFTDFSFMINGQAQELETKPIVYDGTSYLPVRELANLLGYDVEFKADTRTIDLNNSLKPKTSENNLNSTERYDRIAEERRREQELQQKIINEKHALPLDEVFELIDYRVITNHPELEDWQVGFAIEYKSNDEIRLIFNLETNKEKVKNIHTEKGIAFVYPNDTNIKNINIDYILEFYNKETFENERHRIKEEIPLDINISR